MNDNEKIEIENYKKLIHACDNGDIEQVKKYLTKDNVNGLNIEGHIYVNKSPLDTALDSHKYLIVEYLLKNGANPNNYKIAYENYGFGMPIHFAIICEADFFCQEFVAEPILTPIKMLVEYGADINAKNEKGQTPLDIAIDSNHYIAENYLKSIGGKTAKELEKENK